MTIITIYALFGDDIRILSTDIDGDESFYWVSSVALGMFTLELLLSSFAKVSFCLNF